MIEKPKDQADSRGIEQDGERPEASPEQLLRIQIHLLVSQRFHRGAGWFSSIAMFSLINTALILSGAGIQFIGVLGVTKFTDQVALLLSQEWGPGILAVAVVIDLVAAGLFFGLAKLARKHHRWAFYVGMAIYVLDGLVALYIGDTFEVFFHLFILSGLYDGLKASWELDILATAGPTGAAAPGESE